MQTSNIGTAKMTIIWPTATRLIPVASNSINLSLWVGPNLVKSQTVARPTVGNETTINFTSLPSGAMLLTAQAFPNANGSGVAQASASEDVVIAAGNTTVLTITMDSTIDNLTLSPTTPTTTIGGTVTIVPTAHDVLGATVLTSPSTLTFGSSNTGVATVDGAGVVTGVSAGATTITVTETESGKVATVNVTVS